MSATVPRYKNPLIGQHAQSDHKLSQMPIIVPRAFDQEVWAFPSTVPQSVNSKSKYFDVTDEFVEMPPQLEVFRPDTYTNFSLSTLSQACSSLSRDPVTGQVIVQPEHIPMRQQEHPFSYTDRGDYVTTPEADPFSLAVTSLGGVVPSHPSTSTGTFSSSENFHSENTILPVPTWAPNKQMFGADNPQTKGLPWGPPTNFLIPQTVSSIYGQNVVTQPERTKYLETIEPTILTFNDTTVPINANLGISFNPDLPPLIRDQVATPDGNYPLFHRIDPQLIRDAGLPDGRLAEMPQRTGWSARYGAFQAQPPVNPEDIYDPRFNSYGDGQRAYQDITSGTIQYYASDLDSYRDPLFGPWRSKVDHVMFTDPNGKQIPEYIRHVGLDDVKQAVDGQFHADQTFFRQDMMERMMRPMNAKNWQQRFMPTRQQGANQHSMGH